MMTWVVPSASCRTRSAASVEHTMTSTCRTRGSRVDPSVRQAPTSAMFGRPALTIECSRLCAVSASAETTPTRVPGGSCARLRRVSRFALARSGMIRTLSPRDVPPPGGGKLVTAAAQG
jgi:hypothetical protein